VNIRFYVWLYSSCCYRLLSVCIIVVVILWSGCDCFCSCSHFMWFFAARIHVRLDWVVLWNCHNIVPLLSSLYYSTAETPAGNCYNIAPRWVIEPSRWLLLEHGMLFRRLFVLRQTWNWVTFCDPVTRESSDPDTQLTRWPCSIGLMNSKCRLVWSILRPKNF